ncbi:hypothetical protein [Desulfobacca acetoxidans]|uniref:DUF4398 domain-containing protein n=1 Tax=Desulfobacca acetoxidans (strain ATCC 700848 / DSM 11109 / ASRB2) TaxID=880072 RepID=F2NCC1_DESAR|nr:hypothetical protein [Desulfobacca acetoxidans]AEB08985.1 hypothetical protein Desac_1121 [Desulfobacca acetoxidans DSM 11109]
MSYRLSCCLVGLLGWLAFLAGTLPAVAQAPANSQAVLEKAVRLLDRAEQEVAEAPEGALATVKEARQLFKLLQTDLAIRLSQAELTPAQSEQEAANHRIAEDLFNTGERLDKSAQEKLARSQELAAQGDRQASRNLEQEARNERLLALQHFVRSEIYSLRNQQSIFQNLLAAK